MEAVFNAADGVTDRFIEERQSLPDPQDRMEFFDQISKKSSKLMLSKHAYMENEIKKIARSDKRIRLKLRLSIFVIAIVGGLAQTDRMKFIAEIAKKFNFLIEKRRDCMNGELQKIAIWAQA